MKKQVYEIDEKGYLKEIYVSEFDENNEILDEDKQHMISATMPHGLSKPKWTGTEWNEGKTQAEFDEEEYVQSLIPSASEVADAEFEIRTLDTLMKVGLL